MLSRVEHEKSFITSRRKCILLAIASPYDNLAYILLQNPKARTEKVRVTIDYQEPGPSASKIK